MRYKILGLILVLFLVGADARSADYMDSLGKVESLVKQNLGMQSNTSGLADSLVALYVREGLVVLAPAVATRPFRDTITTTQYLMDYSLDSQMIEITKAFWKKKDTLVPVRYLPSDSFDYKFGASYTLAGKTGILAHPSYFDWVQGRMTLYPVPYITGDTIIIDGLAKIKNVMLDTGLMTQIAVSYRPLIAAYATMRCASSLGRDDKAAWWFQQLQFMSQALDITINWGLIGKK